MSADENFAEEIWAPEADGEWTRRHSDVKGGSITLDDFYALLPAHKYFYAPTGELWPATTINSILPPVPLTDERGNPVLDAQGAQMMISPSKWLDRNRPLAQMTWAPRHPTIVEDRLVGNGGWVNRAGARVFNTYHPPTLAHGDPTKAGPWIEHVHKVYPDDAPHLIRWFAHRVQRPHEKVNHALVIGGAMGIGKDTII